jgi:lipopolysaccharide export system permease protein
MVISIYVMVDFFEKWDDFMEAGLPLSKAIIFFGLKIPSIVAQIIPVCILLAVLVALGLMNRHNEIVALKSSGVSIYYLLKPVLTIGLLLSVLLFFFSEITVPLTIAKANSIWVSEVKKKSAVTVKQKNIWIKNNRSISHIKYYNPGRQAAFGVTLHYFDDDFRVIRRIDARKGEYRQGKWIFHEIMEQRLDRENGKYDIRFYEERSEQPGFSPDDLSMMVKKTEEMNFRDLRSYINEIEAEGYDATSYKVDLYAKVAFPFACMILCIIGTGISLKGKREGIALNITYGIASAFLYWIFYSFSVSLGYGEVLPPVAAAWTTNLVFLCFGAFTLLNAE